MNEWSHIRRYNPSGPDYPEAGRDYVLRSEAEEKIEAAEAKLKQVCGAVYEGCDCGCAESVREALWNCADELEALLK